MPLFCPKCGKLMKRIDKPYYSIHGHCLDCHAKFEDKLKKITLAYSQLKKTLGKK